MSYGNSRIPASAQQGIHRNLMAQVVRHRSSAFRKPYAECNLRAIDEAMQGWDGRRPVILDAGCGVGISTIELARTYPECWVIGVDRSEDRLKRRKPYPAAMMPTNMVLVRADLVDFWRLLGDRGVSLARHYILYPNPWPKIGHLGRRWHAHPVFPSIPRLGGVLELRTNWRVYAEEFSCALGALLDRNIAWKEFETSSPLTPFERKYRDSGQTLFHVNVDLGVFLLDGKSSAVHSRVP